MWLENDFYQKKNHKPSPILKLRIELGLDRTQCKEDHGKVKYDSTIDTCDQK